MYTYQLTSNSKRRLTELSELAGVEYYYSRGFRAVICARKFTEDELESITVLAKWRADRRKDLISWADSNTLKDLHEEFLTLKRPTERAKQKAIDAWKRLKAETAAKRDELAVASASEAAAARKMVTIFGKSPVSIEGEIWDPSFIRETVIYLKRGNQEAK